MHDVAGSVAVQVAPPGVAVTVYPEIVDPFAFGAVQFTVTCWLAACVEEITGGLGIMIGVMALVETDAP